MSVGSLAGKAVGGAAKAPTTAFVAGLGIALTASLLIFFSISLTLKAGYIQSTNPVYPYLQAIGMHDVNGKPFLYYMSKAIKQNKKVIEGVDIEKELNKFGESFRLVNATGGLVASTEGSSGNNQAYLAVPIGGKLVIKYEWS